MLNKLLNKSVLLVLLCFIFTGCNSMNGINHDLNDSSMESSSLQNEEISDEQMLIVKQNAYVELNNFITDRYYSDIIDTYFNIFGAGEFVEPKGAPFINGVTQYEIKTIDTALEYSKSEPSMETFDKSVQDLVPKLKKLIDVMNEASQYYNQKDYVDDNYAKGAEYHNEILYTYFEEFNPSLKEFFNCMDVMSKEKRQKNMEMLKEKDLMIKYSMLDILYKAQEIQGEIYGQGISSENILELDLVPVKEKYELLKDSIKSFKEYSEDETRLEKEGYQSITMQGYLNEAGQTKAAVTEIIQRVENKEPVDEFDIKHGYESSENGTPEKLDSKISNLVNYYNNIISNL